MYMYMYFHSLICACGITSVYDPSANHINVVAMLNIISVNLDFESYSGPKL